MHSHQATWNEIAHPHLLHAKSLTQTLQIAVVFSIQGQTEVTENYQRQSIESRFYTSEEAEFFLGALRGAGFLVHPFFSENDFMSWILEEKHLKTSSNKTLLAISTGSSFSGIGAKSLVPAFCRLHSIYMAGPDPHSASLARHKYHATMLLRSLGAEVVPETWCFHPQYGWIEGSRPPTGKLVLLKLIHEGASIGLDEYSAFNVDESLVERVTAAAAAYRQPVIIQELVEGYEVEVPLFCSSQPKAIAPVGISLDSDLKMGSRILTYAASGTDQYGFWDCSALGSELNDNLVATAVASARLLGIRDLGRIDFRITEKKEAKVIDISTSPYISPHSSFSFLARRCGANPSDLPLILVGLAAGRLGIEPY